MRSAVVGLGKLGFPVALAIENKGHEVYGFDYPDQIKRIDSFLESGTYAHQEKGVEELINKSQIKLYSSPNDLKTIISECELIFIAVQTPHSGPEFEGVARLTDERKDFYYGYLENVMSLIYQTYENNPDLPRRTFAIISTVLPGTIRRLTQHYSHDKTDYVYNPSFIAMGTTIHDYLNPEFVIIGSENYKSVALMNKFYNTVVPEETPFIVNNYETIELIKMSYNTFIGMKIIFANSIMEVAYKVGADCDAVTSALSLAKNRIISPKYLKAGCGDGGSCHPRDSIALSYLARRYNLSYDLFSSVMECREKQAEFLVELLMFYPLPKVILGYTYKAETNLTYGSSAILVENILKEKNSPYSVTKYDPFVDEQRVFAEKSVFLIGVNHKQFKDFQFPSGSVVLDPWGYIPVQSNRDRNVHVIRIGRNT